MKKSTDYIEQYRIKTGQLASKKSFGMAGAFMIPGNCGRILGVIVSDAESWDHVSVSLRSKCPNWQEMCFIKDLFWDKEEVVIQYHPAKSQYINNNPYVLHLWKPQGKEIPMPPIIMV